jgi:hypothetical protein
MARKRQLGLALASEAVVITDPLPIEDLEDATVEDYKKLNEKMDKVMSKIKGRKEAKQRKK